MFLTGAALTSPALDWLIAQDTSDVSSATGRTISPAVMDDLDDMAAKLRHMDDHLGGGPLIEIVSAQAGYVTSLLQNGRYTDSGGRRLYGTLGELLRLGGWVSFDSGQQGLAQRFWISALHAAHTAGDRALGSNILGFMSEQAWNLGKLDDAARLAGTAVAGYKGGSPRVSAILHLRAARAHAMLGDTAGCRTFIDRAYKVFQGSVPESGQPEWSYWMDEPSLNEQIGKCFLYLRDYSSAREHLESSLAFEDSWNDSYVRDGVSVLVALANSYAQGGEPEQAGAIATRAIDKLSGRVDSPRMTAKIQRLRQDLQPYRQVSEVQEFIEKADQLPEARTNNG
jgi:hypothetical protein